MRYGFAMWAAEKRNLIFDATLVALKEAGLPHEPRPTDFHKHRILVLAGPKTWVRYYIQSEPSRDRVAAGLYIPKGGKGVAVQAELLRRTEDISKVLGGKIRQHGEVQREYRHFVQAKHVHKTETVDAVVAWCVGKIRAVDALVRSSTVLLDAKRLRQGLGPTADEMDYRAAAEALASGRRSRSPRVRRSRSEGTRRREREWFESQRSRPSSGSVLRESARRVAPRRRSRRAAGTRSWRSTISCSWRTAAPTWWIIPSRSARTVTGSFTTENGATSFA